MANGRTIAVSHINVRESISFLMIKLLLIDFLSGLIVLLYYMSLNTVNAIFTDIGIPSGFHIILFIILVLIEMYISFLVVFQWLNEYYEISGDKIIHRNGFIFRHEDHYTIDHISSIGLEQNLAGKILNYGTIALYDRFDKKTKYLYLIHNPLKYFRIIESLLPTLDEEQHKIREHIFEDGEEKL